MITVLCSLCAQNTWRLFILKLARVAASMGKGVSPCTWKHCSRCLRVFTFFFSSQQCNDARLTVVWALLMLPFPLHVSQVTVWNFENGNVHYYQQILKYREYAKIMATACAVHANVMMGRHASNGCCTTTCPYSASCSPRSCSQTTQRYATATTGQWLGLNWSLLRATLLTVTPRV